MKTFISAATAFYILSPGERLSADKVNPNISRMYVIYKKEGGWIFRYKWHKDWEITTNEVYQNENEALNGAYAHFLKSV